MKYLFLLLLVSCAWKNPNVTHEDVCMNRNGVCQYTTSMWKCELQMPFLFYNQTVGYYNTFMEANNSCQYERISQENGFRRF